MLKQPAASSQQPAASSQQPAASSQQPAASSQQPAASSQQPSGHRCARPVLGAERSDGTRLLSFPSECAEEHRVWAGQLHRRVQLLRELTHRVCLNGAPAARSEFRGAAHTRAPQVARSEAKGRSQQGSLLLGTFLWPAIRGRPEKYLARRAKSGQQNQAAPQAYAKANSSTPTPRLSDAGAERVTLTLGGGTYQQCQVLTSLPQMAVF
jgi:hypothetical protein